MVNGMRGAAIGGRMLIGLLATVVVACGSRAEEARAIQPMAAEMVVANALREAAADDKALVVEFGASWCVWCTHFQRFVESDGAGEVFRGNFVVVTLNVREEEGMTHLEHPGGAAMMDHWGGGSAGLPFYVFLDSSGNKLADSNAMPDGTNIGFPVSEVEIERFVTLLDRTAPRLDERGRALIVDYLTQSASSLQS